MFLLFPAMVDEIDFQFFYEKILHKLNLVISRIILGKILKTLRNNMKKQMKMKTSDKWLELIEESERPMIYDADGWDRSNFQYSFL